MDGIDPTRVSLRVARARELGLTPAELRSSLYDHPSHGIVTPRYLSVDPTAARISEAVALMGPANALGGWASLWRQGNSWFDGTDRQGDDRDVLVHCRPGSQLRVRQGMRPSEGALRPDEVVSLDGYDVTSMARAAYDEMRLARGVREAIVVLDMATSTTSGVSHTSIDDVHKVVEAHRKTRGIAQVRRALPLGDSRSASPWETRTRLVAQLDVGIVRVRVNAPVFDRWGKLLGVADLIDPETGLVIETDGSEHHQPVQHAEDNVREEKFERAGAVVCRISPRDHQDRWAVTGRIAAAQRDAVRSSTRDWTLEQPDWWRAWPTARHWA